MLRREPDRTLLHLSLRLIDAQMPSSFKHESPEDEETRQARLSSPGCHPNWRQRNGMYFRNDVG